MSAPVKKYSEAIAKQLPDWKRYSRPGFSALWYRNDQDFVQWLGFQPSIRRKAVVADYSIQALAQQQNIPTANIGSRIKKKAGENCWSKPDDWWITPEEWVSQSSDIVDWTIKQIKPDPYQPLNIGDILKLTKNSRMKHPFDLETHGIALIINNQIRDGKKYLEKALKRYQEISGDWANEEKKRVIEWLQCSEKEILSLLREQAKGGAKLLAIQ